MQGLLLTHVLTWPLFSSNSRNTVNNIISKQGPRETIADVGKSKFSSNALCNRNMRFQSSVWYQASRTGNIFFLRYRPQEAFLGVKYRL